MTRLEQFKESYTADMIAAKIAAGISSDPCDYCAYDKNICTGKPCYNKTDRQIIKEYLLQEVK